MIEPTEPTEPEGEADMPRKEESYKRYINIIEEGIDRDDVIKYIFENKNSKSSHLNKMIYLYYSDETIYKFAKFTYSERDITDKGNYRYDKKLALKVKLLIKKRKEEFLERKRKIEEITQKIIDEKTIHK